MKRWGTRFFLTHFTFYTIIDLSIIIPVINMNLRKSKQREKILELLKSTESHPTASWIYDQLKPNFPNLSLGTVYRNLNILVMQNEIHEVNFGSTYDRYDAKVDKHYHFICEQCGSITDVELDVFTQINEKIDSMVHGKTQRHRLEFYGICEKCLKQVIS